MLLGRRARRALSGVAGLVLVVAVIGATGAEVGEGAGAPPASSVSVMARGPGALRSVPTRLGPVVMPMAVVVRTSPNWAGWAAKGPFRAVSASWIEPAVTCTNVNSTADYWVGLDGAGTSTVEQIGTESTCSGGKRHESDWYEMYPALAVELGDAVRPGDHLTAGVTTNGQGAFILTLSDSTVGFTQLVRGINRVAGAMSAEVITEAPTPVGSSAVAVRLANFSTMTYTAATANGAPLGRFSPTRYTMEDGPTAPVKAVPGPLVDGTTFTETWKHP
jgi:hypothetical protein